MMESFKPDWYQALCDSDTGVDSSKKRIGKSIDRTLSFLDECVECKQGSEVSHTEILIPHFHHKL